MAKRIIDWNLEKGILTLREYVAGDELGRELEKFDIKKIFPEFDSFTEVQSYITVYGLKQILADVGSAEKTADGKATSAKAKWDDLVAGKVKAPATGGAAKVNKVIVAKAKAASAVISLEGLLTKKTIFPDTFTEEDEAKLQEFYKRMAEHGAQSFNAKADEVDKKKKAGK